MYLLLLAYEIKEQRKQPEKWITILIIRAAASMRGGMLQERMRQMTG
jgi:hypothetical protein